MFHICHQRCLKSRLEGQGADGSAWWVCVLCGRGGGRRSGLQSGHLHISWSCVSPRALLLSSVCDERPQDLSSLFPLYTLPPPSPSLPLHWRTWCASAAFRKQVSGVGWTRWVKEDRRHSSPDPPNERGATMGLGNECSAIAFILSWLFFIGTSW